MVINIPNGDFDSDKGGKKSSGGCGSGGCSTGTCGNGLEKVYPTAAVRYGYMKNVGEFRYPDDSMKFGCGASVIIQTGRGIEFGEMVSLTCDGCDKCVSRDQIREYVDASGPDYYHFGEGKIIRLATQDDESEWDRIRADTLARRKFCQEQADRHNLPMKVIECEHLFGGERIIFYFMAEGRVDFRTLVRELAQEFQTRIEMRQVGARDEARLLADYETCGRECCCKNFLKTLKPVSMKMAKMQKATLDPAKVSGRCGRLKCCLRYEHTTYEELDRKLPRHGARVYTPSGRGTVIGRQILTQLLQIQTDDGGRVALAVEDLLSEEEAARRAQAAQSDTSRADKPQRRRSRKSDRPQQSDGSADDTAESPSEPDESGPKDVSTDHPKGQMPEGDSDDTGKRRQRRGRRRGRRRGARRKGGDDRPDTSGGPGDGGSKPEA